MDSAFLCKFSINVQELLSTKENTENISAESNEFKRNFKCVLSFVIDKTNCHTNISLNLDMPLTSVKSSFSSITFMNHLPVLFVKRELFRNQKLNLKSGMESFRGRSDTLVWKSKLLYQSFKQRFAKISQSRRRPLLVPTPGEIFANLCLNL